MLKCVILFLVWSDIADLLQWIASVLYIIKFGFNVFKICFLFNNTVELWKSCCCWSWHPWQGREASCRVCEGRRYCFAAWIWRHWSKAWWKGVSIILFMFWYVMPVFSFVSLYIVRDQCLALRLRGTETTSLLYRITRTFSSCKASFVCLTCYHSWFI